jgi:acyl dehydratase
MLEDTMVEVETAAEMAQFVGKLLGTSEWLTIDQERIDAFARITGDDNWIHIDVERARREMPGGKTIAHGLLTLSLIPMLSRATVVVRQRSRSINYGSNKVRFTSPVPSGARIRLHRTLEKFEPLESGARMTFGNRMEIEGVERPALVAETITMIYNKVTP